ncbi:hypothetical protein ACHAWC_005435 [Mediolabrus comicus]
MPRSFSPSQNRFPPPPPPPPPPRSRSSPTTTQPTRQSKNNRESSVANQKEGQSHTHNHKQHLSKNPQQTTLIDKDKETWEEVELNDSIIWSSSESNDESDDYIHESALEISKHLQSMHHESVNSFHGMLRKTSIGTESLKDDKSIGALINNLQGSNSQEKGHMESIIGILERNNEVAQSADKIIEIFEMAQQIVRNNDSIIISCCDNGGDDYHCDEEDDDDSRSDSSSNISSSINVMEKKPAQGMKVTNRKSQLLPPPPRPRFGPQQEKQTQKQKRKQKRQQKQKRSKGKPSVEDNDSVVDDSVLVIADRLTKASVIDEPSVIEGPDDEEYWQGHNKKEKSKKGNGRVYKQIGGDELYVGQEETKQSRVHEKAPNTDNIGRKMSKHTRRRSLDRQKRELNEFRKQKQEERRRKKPTATRSYSCPMQTDKKSIVDRLVKKRTQMSMVSNTTESTAQSTPSLLGHQINIRSSMSSGSNRSERRRRSRSRSNANVASDSSNSSRSRVSKTSSRKSSFSRKSRLSRASSRYDDESFESGSVEENRSPIFQLPSPPVDEISVCASSLSCRSGRSPRQPSESGASTTSCRSGRSLQKKQASQRSSSKDKKDSSWTRMKSRFKNMSSRHL